MPTSIEICAGAGGQALGLELAGFEHAALIELDPHACETLKLNRPHWNVINEDVRNFSALEFAGIDLLAGGVPCPPFSVAGKQLGEEDERDLFPELIRLVGECMPKAIMVENVSGLLDSRFADYRCRIEKKLERLGYIVKGWRLVNASDFGVSQLRPRVTMVAMRPTYAPFFSWPAPDLSFPPTVGELLYEEMSANGWEGAKAWKEKADRIAPTLVGGSKKHGGPDLGPTRAKTAWAQMGVDGKGIADTPPAAGFVGNPRLTVKMAALIQGFPKDWKFSGKKTPAYRQVGNAFPPPVAKAVSEAIRKALEAVDDDKVEVPQNEFQYN